VPIKISPECRPSPEYKGMSLAGIPRMPGNLGVCRLAI